MSPDQLQVVRGAVSEALQACGVRAAAVYLFGSVARGTAGSRSDLDLAVLYRDPPPGGLASLGMEIEGEVERRIGRPVQVVVLNRAPVDLVHRVLRDGVLLLEEDPSARVQFEVAARREYFDLKPVLDLYRYGRRQSA